MADVARARRGPLRDAIGRCLDGRVVLGCGHKVPPRSDGHWPTRMRCCFCPEDRRAAQRREEYRQEKERVA